MAHGKISVLTQFECIMKQLSSLESLLPRLSLFPVVNGINPLKDAKVLQEVSSSEILFCDPGIIAPYYQKLERVKWVQSTYAGVDGMMRLVKEKSVKPHFQLSRMGFAFTRQMAEFVIGNIIANERCFKQLYENQKSHSWTKYTYRSLSSCTIGILGVGDIGKRVAKSCKDFDMTVYGLKSNSSVPSKPEHPIDKWFPQNELPLLLQQCDYICCVLPSTPSTHGILSKGMLEHCKERKGILINIGRGNIIKDSEIVEAIQKGWIGGAILDVFEEEPLPASSPLWDFPEVVISPHISSITNDETTNFFLENLALYDEGKQPKYLVDWDKEY